MQRFMDRLDLLPRAAGGRVVLGAWVALLLVVAAVRDEADRAPDRRRLLVPGSGSEAVDRATRRLRRRPAPDARRRRRAPARRRRRRRARASSRASTRSPTTSPLARADAARAGRRRARRRQLADRRSPPLKTGGNMDDTADSPSTCASELGLGAGPRDGVETYLVGQQALWAGMQDLSKEDLEQAEVDRLPDRPADPARRLRLAGRGAAAARCSASSA